MAVAFDAVGSAKQAYAIAPLGTDTLTYSVTVVSGTNGYVVVGVAIGGNTFDTITGVTLAGNAMTALGGVNSNDGITGGVRVFGRASTATGSQTVVVTGTAPATGIFTMESGAMSFTGVDGSTPVGTVVTAFGNSGTASVTISGGVAGDLGIYNLCNGSGGAAAPGSNETERWDQAQDGASAGGSGAGGQSTDVAGTMTSTFTSDSWGIVGFPLKQVSAGNSSSVSPSVSPSSSVSLSPSRSPSPSSSLSASPSPTPSSSPSPSPAGIIVMERTVFDYVD